MTPSYPWLKAYALPAEGLSGIEFNFNRLFTDLPTDVQTKLKQVAADGGTRGSEIAHYIFSGRPLKVSETLVMASFKVSDALMDFVFIADSKVTHVETAEIKPESEEVQAKPKKGGLTLLEGCFIVMVVISTLNMVNRYFSDEKPAQAAVQTTKSSATEPSKQVASVNQDYRNRESARERVSN